MATYGSETTKAPDFRAGYQTTVAIRPKNLLRSLILRVRGDFVVTGGTGAGTIHSDALFRLLRNVRVQADSNPIMSVSGQTLRVMEKLFERSPYDQVTPANLAPGSKPFDLMVELPFYMPHSAQPDAHALPTWAVSSPMLMVTWGTAAEWAEGTDATSLSFANVEVDLQEVPLMGVGTDPTQFRPVYYITHERLGVVSGAQQSLEFDQTLPLDELRGVLVETLAGGSNNLHLKYNSNVVSELLLNVNGTNLIERTATPIMQNRNKKTYGLSAREPGVILLDAAEDKRTTPGDLWTVRGGLKPHLGYDAQQQAGGNVIRATLIVTNGRVAA